MQTLFTAKVLAEGVLVSKRDAESHLSLESALRRIEMSVEELHNTTFEKTRRWYDEESGLSFTLYTWETT
jgi:hypothetical protein